jgi:ribosomal protein L11 methyltransferase
MAEVPWRQVTVQIPVQMEDAVSDFLTTLTGRGVCLREEKDETVIDAFLNPSAGEDQILVIQRFVDSLVSGGNLPDKTGIRIREVSEEDWMSVFRSQHTTIRISDRLVIRPTWCDPAGEKDLVLDPGMAFGTGSHPTTRMCLELLDGIIDDNSTGRMFDLGTGSGILAMAGARLGIEEILAVDNDPIAVEAAGGNVRENDLCSIIRVEEGGAEKAEGVYDVITANLSASPLRRLCEQIVEHLAPAGCLIISGLTSGEKGAVVDSFQRLGLNAVRSKEEDTWVAVLLRRTK